MSIFDRVRTFQPLTPERRRYLRLEIYGYGIGLVFVVLLLLFQLHREAINAFCYALIGIHLHNFGAWLGNLLHTREWGPAIVLALAPIASAMKPIILALKTPMQLLAVVAKAAVYLSIALFMLWLIALKQIGLTRPADADNGVLIPEIQRWWARFHQPTIKLGMWTESKAIGIATNIMLLLLSYIFLCTMFTGSYTSLLPGNQVLAAFDSGVSNWLLAALRDAHLYSKTTVEELPVIRFYLAALGALIGTVPFAAMLSQWLPSPVPKICLTPTHIKFPGKRKRPWSDVAKVSVHNAETIIVEFRTGGRSSIPIKSLSASDLQTLVEGIEELCIDCEVSADLSSLATTSGAALPTTFTRVWNEGLNTHVKSTVFTPLEAGAELADGTLKIIRQLASTPWSATYLARRDGRQVVTLKELFLNSDNENGKARELFERECRMLLSINHTGIAKVLDHFVSQERDYLVLEYCPGSDLQEIVRNQGPMEQKKVINIAIQLCEIMEYLHGQSPPVVHRDISPDNIVLDEKGNAHLIDFGAAKHLVQNATGTLIGKQAYVPPEQLRGKPSIQSDLYALGATLHFLLTGKPPRALTECSPREENKSIDEALDQLVGEMTRFEAAQRPASATEVRARLAEIANGVPLERTFILRMKDTVLKCGNVRS